MAQPLQERYPYRVLYVEDEESIRSQVVHSLTRWFSSVVTAVNGQDGFEKFLATAPDLIITGIVIPKMDGLEMSRRIRDQNQDIPIVVITALSDIGRLIKAINIDISQFLLKPLIFSKLQNAIAKCIKEIEVIRLQLELTRANAELAQKRAAEVELHGLWTPHWMRSSG